MWEWQCQMNFGGRRCPGSAPDDGLPKPVTIALGDGRAYESRPSKPCPICSASMARIKVRETNER